MKVELMRVELKYGDIAEHCMLTKALQRTLKGEAVLVGPEFVVIGREVYTLAEKDSKFLVDIFFYPKWITWFRLPRVIYLSHFSTLGVL